MQRKVKLKLMCEELQETTCDESFNSLRYRDNLARNGYDDFRGLLMLEKQLYDIKRKKLSQ